MEIFYPCDRVITDKVNPNLPVSEIQELNTQMNCNLEFSDESEMYFEDGDTLWPVHMSIVDEMEMFMRDAECEVWK
jgi:hypothetical protein